MVDQFRDKTERFMHVAKQRAHDLIDEVNPKLTSLERGYWIALRKHRARERNLKQTARWSIVILPIWINLQQCTFILKSRKYWDVSGVCQLLRFLRRDWFTSILHCCLSMVAYPNWIVGWVGMTWEVECWTDSPLSTNHDFCELTLSLQRIQERPWLNYAFIREPMMESWSQRTAQLRSTALLLTTALLPRWEGDGACWILFSRSNRHARRRCII